MAPTAGASRFHQFPLSKKTKDALREAKFVAMTDIQRASPPHALCGRDILGAAKIGSGKPSPSLSLFWRSCIERGGDLRMGLAASSYRLQESWLVSYLMCWRLLAKTIILVLAFSLVVERTLTRRNNVLMSSTYWSARPEDCCNTWMKLPILIVHSWRSWYLIADRILDSGFKQALNAIISQLPKRRQTLLFSATQTKSIQDLARLSLKDPEYLSVHEESVTATPTMLKQIVMVVDLDQKLDMLWCFIKTHLQSKTLVFLSSCKQVKFVFEAFKKLHPGIALKCLHGRMKQERRTAIYSSARFSSQLMWQQEALILIRQLTGLFRWIVLKM